MESASRCQLPRCAHSAAGPVLPVDWPLQGQAAEQLPMSTQTPIPMCCGMRSRREPGGNSAALPKTDVSHCLVLQAKLRTSCGKLTMPTV